jgi:predicted NBD/HSP70 family sugar kinase
MSVSGLAPFDRRGHQRRVILDTLRHAGFAARSEIASVTGMSPQVVTSLVDELVGEGLVRVAGRRPSARGQPPVDLALNLEGGFAIGVQVETGRLSGIVTDLGGHVRAEATLECATDDPDRALASLRRLVDDLKARSAVDTSRLWGVGIVFPGPFGAVAGIESDPLAMPKWSRASFRERFSEALSLPVFVGNDATAAAVGEHLNGIARDLRSFFYLYLSEGIGGGLFVEGQPVLGAFGNAGEVGRMRLPANGNEREPQTLEDLASLSALRRLIERAGRPDASDLSVEALLAADATILDAWLTDAARCLRMAIANIENLLDPEAIVIGGQVPAPVLQHLLDRMQPLLTTVSDRSDRRTARILIGSAGRISPALGGATLPLFYRLTPQPRAAKSHRPTRISSRGADGQALPAHAPARRAS